MCPHTPVSSLRTTPAVRICVYVAEFNDLPPDASALKRLEKYSAECDWSKPMQSFYL